MRILLIEDNTKLAKLLKKTMETEKYVVDWCANAEDAYELLITEPFAVIILDIALPGMDGITLAQKIRQEKNDIPIIMLTARDSVTDKIIGLDSGADDYVIKPFNYNELLARIRAHARRGIKKPELLYVVDSLTLNPVSHIVSRNKIEIHLSAREYALLEFLMRNAGHIMTKQQILENVWDSAIDPFSNSVDVYIGYLRKKIDKAFPNEKQLIYTVKGFGYKIEN